MIKQANDNGVDVIAIINPNNGPGGFRPNEDYARGIKLLKSAGAILVGYVQTHWGTRDVSEVKNEIELYRKEDFGVHGVYLDEVPNLWNNAFKAVPYYKLLYDFVKAAQWPTPRGADLVKIVVMSPGAQTDKAYASISDILVLFKGYWDCQDCHQPDGSPCSYYDCIQWRPANTSQSFDPSKPGFPSSWMLQGQRQSFAAIVHSCRGLANMTDALSLAKDRNFGHIFITDQGGPTPYTHLPSYWNGEMSAVAAANDDLARTPAGAAAERVHEALAVH